jgi:flavin-binding protein dodecin
MSRPRASIAVLGWPCPDAGQIMEATMEDDTVYRRTDLVGSSRKSVSDAIETAIARAAKTLRHIEWFEVGEIRGRVQDGKVSQYQVSIKVGFRVEA